MKKFKNSVILTALVAVMLITSLTVGISVFATPSSSEIFSPSRNAFNEFGYGSHDNGIPWQGQAYLYPSLEVNGHGNLNFEKGLEGWLVGTIPNGKLKVDSNGNKCLTLTPEKQWDSVVSVMFPIPQLKVGQKPGLLYKWRGNSHAFQINLIEVKEVVKNSQNQILGKEVRTAFHDGYGPTPIWQADEEKPEDWNISFTINKDPVEPLTAESATDKIYYYVVFEANSDPDQSSGIDIDDIQVTLHDTENRKVLDLDGKVIYDLNNLPKPDVLNYDFSKINKKDERAKIKVDVDDLLAKKTGSNNYSGPTIGIKNTDDSTKSGALLWVIIAAGALLVIAAAVVTVVVIRKKRKTVNSEQSDEVKEETIE